MSENTTEKKLLTPAQRRGVEALLTNGNVTAAALAANVHRSTLYKWQGEEPFIEALHEAEAQAVAALARVLVGLGDSAAAALRAALGSDQKMTTRLRAAQIVMDNLLTLRELVALDARIAALEAHHAPTD